MSITNSHSQILSTFLSIDCVFLKNTITKIMAAGSELLNFDKIVQNSKGSMKALLPSQIKILEAGYYQIFGSVCAASVSGGVTFQTELRIKINNVVIYSQSITKFDTAPFTLTVNVDYDFKKNDLITLEMYTSSAITIKAEENEWASQFFVFQTRK